MYAYEKLAKLLRVDKDVIRNIEERLGAETGIKKGAEKIVEENNALIKSHLERLGLNYAPLLAEDVYASLLAKIKSDDQKIFPTIPGYRLNNREGSELIAQALKRVVHAPRGFFLKHDRIEGLLRAEPPPKIMKFLGYRDIDSLLAKEDILEVFSALRFLEGNDWLNGGFFKQYEKLIPADFEQREMIVKT
ncbi:hypothetical protein HYV91_03125, partial [Candidatus Wolfebacteria bacterium]|nr:hypothetical protein [Candidatus Wolfebacteria bacterium]